MDSLIVHFGVVYDPETRLSIVDYVTEGHDFEDCCAKVEDFNRFVRDINGMVCYLDNHSKVLGNENHLRN